MTTASTQRMKLSRKSSDQLNVEILMSAFGNDISDQRLLILCLHRTDQKILAKVFENGGGLSLVFFVNDMARRFDCMKFQHFPQSGGSVF